MRGIKRSSGVLLFTLLSWGSAQGSVTYVHDADRINVNESAGAIIFGLVFLVFALALYMLPTIIANNRKHPNVGAIAAINIFLGWSLIGWVAALVWAIKNPESVVVAPPAMVTPHSETKTCPFCAEEVLAAAIKCKHCGSDLTATPPNP